MRIVKTQNRKKEQQIRKKNINRKNEQNTKNKKCSRLSNLDVEFMTENNI